MVPEEKIESPMDIDSAKGKDTFKGIQMVSEQRVWDALKNCYDPEIPVNIIDLGLVYNVKIEEKNPGEAEVYIRMTLTAPGCSMGPMIAADAKRRVQQIPGVTNVIVEIVFEPVWNPDMMSEAAKLTLNMG
jgi:metal-sulfur cluster biosynthetic enzyme